MNSGVSNGNRQWQHTRQVRALLRQRADGQLAAAAAAGAAGQRQRRQLSEQQRTSRAVEQQVYRGALKSALKRADGKPILPHCQDTRGKVAALFPDAPNPVHVPLDTADCPHLTFTAGFVRNVVRKLDPAKAGGPSGMTVPHVKAAINHSEEAAERAAAERR